MPDKRHMNGRINKLDMAIILNDKKTQSVGLGFLLQICYCYASFENNASISEFAANWNEPNNSSVYCLA